MKKFLIFLIRIYQRYISCFLIAKCRYYPTCSQYMLDAINTFGIFKGTWLGILRIISCHPFSNKYGYDPVPKKIKKNGD